MKYTWVGENDLTAHGYVEASFRPFKLSHESTLDSVSVLLLMAIFVSDIQKDLNTVDSNLRTFLISVFFASLV